MVCGPEIPVGRIANLKGHYFQPSLSVSLSVCLCVSLTGTSTIQRWPILMKLGHKDLTLVKFGRDHNGPDRPQRDRATPCENFKKNLKNHRIRISKFLSIIFLRLCLLYIVKKNFDSIRTKLTEEIHFEVCHSGNLPPIVACCVSTGGRRAGAAAAVDDRDVRIHKYCVLIVPRILTTDPRTGGIGNWGRNWAVKTHRLVVIGVGHLWAVRVIPCTILQPSNSWYKTAVAVILMCLLINSPNAQSALCCFSRFLYCSNCIFVVISLNLVLEEMSLMIV